MIHIKYVLEFTATFINQYSFDTKEIEPSYITWGWSGKLTHLGSAQKDVLSSSGTISVTFKYLAIATMSHICTQINLKLITIWIHLIFTIPGVRSLNTRSSANGGMIVKHSQLLSFD